MPFSLFIIIEGRPQNLKPINSYFDGSNIILGIWTTVADSVKLPVDSFNPMLSPGGRRGPGSINHVYRRQQALLNWVNIVHNMSK